MGLCKFDGCELRARSLGFCDKHYKRFDYYRKRGTQPKKWPEFCVADGCGKKSRFKGLCNAHYLRKRRLGNENAPKVVSPKGSGHIDQGGYKIIYVDGRRLLEHRYVMETKIGRPVRPEETVHHLNGDRIDNRIENLQLWNRKQPAGQAVSDKVKWAKEILSLYGDAFG